MWDNLGFRAYGIRVWDKLGYRAQDDLGSWDDLGFRASNKLGLRALGFRV